MLVSHPHPDGLRGLLPGVVHQGCWHHILYPCPCIASGQTHEKLKRVRCHGNSSWRQESEQREEEGASPVAVPPSLGQEQRLQVVAEGDGDDGEVCWESEDREEREEAVAGVEQPGVVCWWLEVKGVEVVDVGEGKDASEGQEEIEAKNEKVVAQQDWIQLWFVGNWSDLVKEYNSAL